MDLPPRRLCLLWGGVPHQMLRGPDVVQAVWVTIPLSVVLRWRLPERLIQPLLAPDFVADATPRMGDLDLLHQWLEDLPGRTERQSASRQAGASAAIVLLEIEARLRRLAQRLSESRSPVSEHVDASAHPDRGLAAVEAMAQFICRNFRDEIGIAQIAYAAPAPELRHDAVPPPCGIDAVAVFDFAARCICPAAAGDIGRRNTGHRAGKRVRLGQSLLRSV